jgi:hypothetical protein
MWGFVAVHVVHCFPMEWRSVRYWMLAAGWKRSVIALAIVEVMIHVPVKVIASVIPGTRSNKSTIYKPFRTVIAVWSTSVRRLLVVTIRTDGRRANLHRNLCRCGLATCQEKTRSTDKECEIF